MARRPGPLLTLLLLIGTLSCCYLLYLQLHHVRYPPAPHAPSASPPLGAMSTTDAWHDAWNAYDRWEAKERASGGPKGRSRGPKQRGGGLKVPFPIFVTSLPKSGTTTLHDYFVCGGQRAIHHGGRRSGRPRRHVSDCMLKNIVNGDPPFEGCGDFDVWSDTGYEDHKRCYHPTLSALDRIYEAHPNVTLLHVIRDEVSWLKSVQNFQQAMMMRHLKNCVSPDGIFPIKVRKDNTDSAAQFTRLYRNHTAYVRKFAATHPSVTYLEFRLEDPQVASKLEAAVGISAKCWGKSNRNEELELRTAKKER